MCLDVEVMLESLGAAWINATDEQGEELQACAGRRGRSVHHVGHVDAISWHQESQSSGGAEFLEEGRKDRGCPC